MEHTQPTPGPWFVRKLERSGELKDCFVAAPDVHGYPYDAEILGDDEYRDGIARKLADCELIVECVNGYAALEAQRDELLAGLERIANPIPYEQANVPEGYTLDGHALLAQVSKPLYYQTVARALIAKHKEASHG